ncbi:MAG TPA: YciI family protein [Actinopolymorphaceae bacterium]
MSPIPSSSDDAIGQLPDKHWEDGVVQRYLFAIYEDEARFAGLTGEELDGVWQRHDDFVFAVKRAGAVLVSGEALAPRSRAMFVRPGTRGHGSTERLAEPVLIDDPARAETLGGYYLIEARDDVQAQQLAALCPVEFGFVEVRPVMAAGSR